MSPRFVREPSDLPDHDLVLAVEPDRPHSPVCHVRHFVSRGRQVVVAGSLDDEAASVTISAIDVVREMARHATSPSGRSRAASSPRLGACRSSGCRTGASPRA